MTELKKRLFMYVHVFIILIQYEYIVIKATPYPMKLNPGITYRHLSRLRTDPESVPSTNPNQQGMNGPTLKNRFAPLLLDLINNVGNVNSPMFASKSPGGVNPFLLRWLENSLNPGHGMIPGPGGYPVIGGYPVPVGYPGFPKRESLPGLGYVIPSRPLYPENDPIYPEPGPGGYPGFPKRESLPGLGYVIPTHPLYPENHPIYPEPGPGRYPDIGGYPEPGGSPGFPKRESLPGLGYVIPTHPLYPENHPIYPEPLPWCPMKKGIIYNPVRKFDSQP